MIPAETQIAWRHMAAGVAADFAEWRAQHPTATLAAIERALDEQWAATRARLIEAAALASAATAPGAAAPRRACPSCRTPMHETGQATRQVTTRDDQRLTLRRHRFRCPACGAGLSPP